MCFTPSFWTLRSARNEARSAGNLNVVLGEKGLAERVVNLL